MKMIACRMLAIALGSGLLVAAPQLSSAQSEGPLKGRYTTNFGPVKLFPDKDGVWVGIYNYKGLPAHLYLTRNGNFYDAIWVQGTSEVRCNDKKTGSPYWGRARVAFTQGGKRMLSIWNYCNRKLKDTKQFRWTGDHAD